MTDHGEGSDSAGQSASAADDGSVLVASGQPMLA